MMRLVDLRSGEGRPGLPMDLVSVVPRAPLDVEHALDTVRPIVADVAARGEVAVLDHGERLDGVRPERLRVPGEVLAQALADLDDDVRESLGVAIARVRAVHADQKRAEHTSVVAPGGDVEPWAVLDPGPAEGVQMELVVSNPSAETSALDGVRDACAGVCCYMACTTAVPGPGRSWRGGCNLLLHHEILRSFDAVLDDPHHHAE